MAEPYQAMRFMDPEPELLNRVRGESENHFGSEYSMDLVNHEFVSPMLEGFNDEACYERRSVDGIVPDHPIAMIPTIEDDVANYFRLSQLQDILEDGSFVVRLAAYHEDFEPAESDLMAVYNKLQEERSSIEDISESVKVEDYLYNQNLREKALNEQFDDFDPIKIFFSEVPLKMADSERYVDAFRRAMMTTYEMEGIKNLDMFLELQKRSMSFDQVQRALQAEDYTDQNTAINIHLNDSENDRRLKMGLANGLGVEGADKDEAVFRVKEPIGLSESGEKVAEKLEENGLPIGGLN